MDFLLLLGTAIPSAEVHKARRTVKLVQGTATPAQGSVVGIHTPTGRNVAFAPIAPHFAQPLYLRRQPVRCRVPARRVAGSEAKRRRTDGRARPGLAKRGRPFQPAADRR